MVWMRGKPSKSSYPAPDSVFLFEHVKAKPFGRFAALTRSPPRGAVRGKNASTQKLN
jgi:hypothetical protein